MREMDTRSRRKYLGTVATAAGIGLAGCMGGGGGGSGGGGGGSSGQQSHTLQGSKLDRSDDDLFGQAFLDFSQQLQEKTNNRITINEAVLESEEEAIDAVSGGSIDFYMTSMGSLTTAFGPEYGFLESPFLSEGYGHYLAMLNEYVIGGPFNDKMINDGNQRLLASMYRGLRGTITQKPVHSVADVQNVDMRLPQFENWVQIWGAVGVNPTPVDSSEVYQSLQTGVVNAVEAPIQQFVDDSYYEVTSHFAKTQHLPQTFNWMINEDAWQSFSNEDKQIFRDTLHTVSEQTTNQVAETETQLFQQMQQEHNITVIPPEQVDRQSFIDAATPRIEQYFENTWEASFDEVQALAEQGASGVNSTNTTTGSG